MTSFFRDYILNVILSLIILILAGALFEYAKDVYYKNTPLDWYYVSTGLHAEDVCVGDRQQAIISNRRIVGDVEGYPAEVIKELFLVERGLQTKVYEEATAPFVEKTAEGVTTRLQPLPDTLTPGEYQWVLHVILFINGVQRDDVPLITSNIFRVENCETPSTT